MSIRRVLFFAAIFLTVTSVSRATTLTFTMSGVEHGTFQLSDSPTPDYVSPAGNYAEFYSVPVDNSTFGSPLNFFFYIGVYGGGFGDPSDGNGYYGAQIFSGSVTAPTFAPGSFSFTGIDTNGPIIETLTISDSTAVTTTPEPSSFALLFTGMAAIGAAVRRKVWPSKPADLA